MSLAKSVKTNSSSSIVSEETSTVNDLPNDSSNRLYDDKDHFQSIFSNDSRFFDTSLHLFKSYAQLGYIPMDSEKIENLSSPTLTSTSHGLRHRWKVRLLSLANTAHVNHTANGTIKSLLTPTLLKKNDLTNSYRPGSKIIRNGANNYPQRPEAAVRYQQKSIPNENNLDENGVDEPDIIITRL